MADIDRVSVIGLGAMGLPMAQCLQRAGLVVTGYEPYGPRREQAESAGVETCDTPASAVRGADAIVLAVRDRTQAEEALFGEHGVVGSPVTGTAILLTSTIGIAAAHELGARAAAAGYEFADAPVSGGPARAGRGDLLMLVGAPASTFERIRALMNVLGSTVDHVGDRFGDGQAMKVVNQLLAGVHIAAAAEAIALAKALGLDLPRVLATMDAGAAQSFMLRDRGPRMLDTLDGTAEVRSQVGIFVKDMDIVAQTAQSLGLPLPLARTAEEIYQRAANAGMSDADDSAIVRLYLRD